MTAFASCRHLQELVLPSGLKKIDDYVFYGCSSLVNITIPSTVIEIGNYAFQDCDSLREVAVHNDEMQMGVDSITYEPNSFTNCSSLERFKFPSLWTRLDNIIKAGQRDIEAKLDNIPAVEWRGRELDIPAVHREIEDQRGRMELIAEVDEEKLSTVKGLISYHEMKEATTQFELALWKARIDEEANDINRNACRIEVPGPVKDNILQYLG